MKLVIIGNGVAGIMTARFVAEQDPSVEILVYSDENYLYYPRPRLIELVAGEISPEEIVAYSEEWYARRGIRNFLGRPVTEIRPEAHQVVIAGGTVVSYDRLLIASGARARIPPLPGSDKRGTYALRTMADALTLRDQAEKVEHVVILGGGLLGLETARALRAHGVDVTVVEILPHLLPRQLDAVGGDLLQSLIEKRGIHIITGDTGDTIQGNGGVESVRLASGKVLPAGMVVISAGVQPNIDLPQKAGIACKRGVIVDEHLHTSAQDIYAVGDVAEFDGRVWGIIPAALAQARVAASQIVGKDTLYHDIVPSTTLTVTGIEVTSMGQINATGEGDRELRYMDADAGVYKKLVLQDGHIVGAILMNDRSDLGAISQLMIRQVDVSTRANELLREGFDLKSLLKT